MDSTYAGLGLPFGFKRTASLLRLLGLPVVVRSRPTPSSVDYPLIRGTTDRLTEDRLTEDVSVTIQTKYFAVLYNIEYSGTRVGLPILSTRVLGYVYQ